MQIKLAFIIKEAIHKHPESISAINPVSRGFIKDKMCQINLFEAFDNVTEAVGKAKTIYFISRDRFDKVFRVEVHT